MRGADHDRAARRHFGLAAALTGLALIGAGIVAIREAHALRELGVIAVGCGIGVAVAGLWIALGWRPPSNGG